MDGGAWWAAVHGVARSRTRLSSFTFPFHFHALEKEMTTHSSVLVWRIPGTGSLVGCRLWGRSESDTTEVTQQQQQGVTVAAGAADVPTERRLARPGTAGGAEKARQSCRGRRPGRLKPNTHLQKPRR